MSAYPMWQLSCDGPTALEIDDVCPAGLDDTTADTAGKARANGKAEGWTTVRINKVMLDLCPECTFKYEQARYAKDHPKEEKNGTAPDRGNHQKAGGRRQPKRR